MGGFSQIDTSYRIPIVIPIPRWLMDHHFQGKPVFPAVETMEVLAGAALDQWPFTQVSTIQDANFDKFLFMAPTQSQLEASVEINQKSPDGLQAALKTHTKAPRVSITRTKTHARMTIKQHPPVYKHLPLDIAAALEGICKKVEPQAVYSDLVPFGQAFQNLSGPVFLSMDGALARIKTPNVNTCVTTQILGSPFALDTAFHAACVWAQHYRHIVAFPVAIEQRIIIQPTSPGHTYTARILPRDVGTDDLIFDIWLLDDQGGLCEAVHGVHMRDVSSGLLKPVSWIMASSDGDPFKKMRLHCQTLAVIDRNAIIPAIAPHEFSLLETKRYNQLGSLRRNSYAAGRIALKRLYRQLMPEGQTIPAQNICTVAENSFLPRSYSDGKQSIQCSMSHAPGYAFAAGDACPLGVDVEAITDKALKSRSIFMSEEELRRIDRTPMSKRNAALRAWSIKECVAKAFQADLADIWRMVHIVDIGEGESHFSYDGKINTAVHVTVKDHLFTLYSTNSMDQ